MVKVKYSVVICFFLFLVVVPRNVCSTGGGTDTAPSCYADEDGQVVAEFCKDAFNTVVDVSKLVISITTGLFLLAPTLFSLLKVDRVRWRWLIFLGFILLAISVFLGVNVIYSIAGNQRWNEYDILENYIGIQAFFQLFLFTLGAILIGLSYLKNALMKKRKPYLNDVRIGIALAEIYKLKGDYDEALRILKDIEPNSGR